MKRAILAMQLPKERQFQIQLPRGAVVHNYLMSYAEKKVVTGIIGQAGRVVDEIPTILVEVDPDEVPEDRRFVVAEEAQIVESDGSLKYLGSVMSQASQGKVFHLFEEVLVTP